MTDPAAPTTDRPAILIVDDTPANLSVLHESLSRAGYRVLVARDGQRALEQLDHVQPDLVLLDVVMPGIDGFETCRRIKARPGSRDLPVVFMTALSDIDHKVEGFAAGAVDYVTKPLQHEEVLARVDTHLTLARLRSELRDANERLEQRVAERTAELAQSADALRSALAEVEELKERLHRENVYLREEIRLNHNFECIVGRSSAIQQVLRQVEQVAETDATVLVLGETGTGKELIARSIHDLSAREGRALVKVNCGALPESLIASELFGHEKGAFTGAVKRKPGRFELADGGTLFLDEIGDLPADVQCQLLRVLQEGEYERVGGTETLSVDVRIIAATHRDLPALVARDEFRRDLYYRLNVFPIRVPSLRSRLEDVPELVRHFVDKHGGRLGRQIETIPKEALEQLQSYHWPGNVRELENIVERAVILSPGDVLQLGEPPGGEERPAEPSASSLEDVERSHVVRVLTQADWKIEGAEGAAARLGLNPSTLRSRMRKLGIERPRPRRAKR